MHNPDEWKRLVDDVRMRWRLQHKPLKAEADRVVPPSPSTGGWGKFIRDVLSKQKCSTRRRRRAPLEPDRKKSQQLKKGGRGWLHFKWQK